MLEGCTETLMEPPIRVDPRDPRSPRVAVGGVQPQRVAPGIWLCSQSVCYWTSLTTRLKVRRASAGLWDGSPRGVASQRRSASDPAVEDSDLVGVQVVDSSTILAQRALSNYTLRPLSQRTTEHHCMGESDRTEGQQALEDRRALDLLFSATYEELRRLAASVRRGDPNATISPTALVNEAWLKLSATPAIGSANRLHFKRVAARAMRQVLIEAARRRNAGKRGSGVALVTFTDSVEQIPSTADELLSLDEALESLARINPRQALMVESRFFGGLDVAETAELLEVSEATILRDWRAAKAWLAHELRAAS